MRKQLPHPTTDREAELFVETADLTDYDLSAMLPVSFEFSRKSKQVNMRMSEQLLEAVKRKAEAQGITYQRFIRLALEQAIGKR